MKDETTIGNSQYLLKAIHELLDDRLPKRHVGEQGPELMPVQEGTVAWAARERAKDSDERIRVYVEMVERAEEAERRVDELEPALARSETERDEWKAKHAALRAAVQVMLAHAEPDSWEDLRLRRILDRDDARAPQANPDTVTLRRDDSDLEVEINSKKGKPSSCIVRHQGMTVFHGVSLDAIVTDRPLRAALGWGDSDDA